MDNKYDKSKNKMLQSHSDFDIEAQEGWDEIGLENWDQIHRKLESKIDLSGTPVKKISVQKKSFSYKYIGIAAMILIILGVSLKLILPSSSTHTLFAEYYQPLNAPEDNFRGDQAVTIEEKAYQASDAYEELEFKKAIAFYSELLKENPNHPKYVLFLGLSYINDGKYDEAIVLYNSYTPKNVSYDDDIQWYLALAHLKKGEVQTSRNLLINISNKEKNDYALTAQELVTKLDRLK